MNESLGIEIWRDGRFVIADLSSVKDGEKFRMFDGRKKGKPRIAAGDAYINDAGNWSVKVRSE